MAFELSAAGEDGRKDGKEDLPPLVWIDCEMTGLDLETDVIIEVFCIITNGDLEILDEEGWGCVVHQEQSVMDSMDEWCTRTHRDSGLTQRVLSSGTTPTAAAAGLLAYIQRFEPIPRQALLAGNTVHADKAFLRKSPYTAVHDHLHHRILDVSSIKEAAKRWCGETVLRERPRKRGLHRAREDIEESIEEARFYMNRIFKDTKSTST